MENYKSATDPQFRPMVEKQIKAELAEGYYKIVKLPSHVWGAP